MNHRVLLADCDAMFVAVARMVDPEGAGRSPLLVVGGRRGGRGVVCSASYEARVFGVRSGMPIGQAERLCPAAMFVPVPRHECGAKSREIRAVLEEWSPVVEPASVDEFYLGLDGTEALYRNEPLAVTASRIREDVLSRTGLTVSIGGGTNRLIAKLAVERAKPRPGTSGTGIHIVAEGHGAEFVAGLDLSDLPGVGPRFAEALRRHGLVRVRDALGLDRGTLGGWFGPRTGAWLYDRIRGISRTPVSSYAEPKSVSRESTFHVDLETDDALETELVRLVTRVCHDLRSDGLGARTVTVKLRDFDFRTRQASRTLDEAISSDRAVLPVARQLLRRLREERRTGARLLGVGFTQLSPGDRAVQLGLFPGTTAAAETERDRTVARTVDRIQERFGSQAIRPARLASPPAHRGMIEEDEVG
ncbi:MAG: DNA polymerase IV [Gemmatimonadota bacterium]|jgi:DNA polymerase-4|nr:DNA polymerase IV [Gemmatimonadota bacterium]